METPVAAMLLDPEARLRGCRRLEPARQARAEGIEVATTLLHQLEALAVVG